MRNSEGSCVPTQKKTHFLFRAGPVLLFVMCSGSETFIISAALARPGWATQQGEVELINNSFSLLPSPSPVQGGGILEERRLLDLSWEAILQVFSPKQSPKTHPSVRWQSSNPPQNPVLHPTPLRSCRHKNPHCLDCDTRTHTHTCACTNTRALAHSREHTSSYKLH